MRPDQRMQESHSTFTAHAAYRAIGTTTRLKHSKASSNDWFRIFSNAVRRELLAIKIPGAH